MKTLKICLIILCLLCVSTVGLPQSSGATFFMAAPIQPIDYSEIPQVELKTNPETGELVPEEWREINGFESLYHISNYGRVYSVPRRNKPTGGLRKLFIGTTGYWFTNLNYLASKKYKTIKIHRLVALAFIPNPDNKPQVNHKDGDKLNSFVCNLEWNTNKENIIHAFDTGLAPSGINRTQSKLTKEDIDYIKKVHVRGRPKGHKRNEVNPFSSISLGKKFGVSHDVINKVVRNKSYQR